MFSWNNIKKTFKEKVIENDDLMGKIAGIAEVAGKSIVATATNAFKFIIEKSAVTSAEMFLKVKKNLENEIAHHPTDVWRNKIANDIATLQDAIRRIRSEINSTADQQRRRCLQNELPAKERALREKEQIRAQGSDPNYVAQCKSRLSSHLAKKENMLTMLAKDLQKNEEQIMKVEEEIAAASREDKEKLENDLSDIKSHISRVKSLQAEIARI